VDSVDAMIANVWSKLEDGVASVSWSSRRFPKFEIGRSRTGTTRSLASSAASLELDHFDSESQHMTTISQCVMDIRSVPRNLLIR